MAKNLKLPENPATDTRYHLLASLKMRIEEINSAMTHGKSEAWCAGFAIVYVPKEHPARPP